MNGMNSDINNKKEHAKDEIIIEVCCGSADDAARASDAGADRVELNLALEAGGLTPSVGMLKTALSAVSIPIVCMVRPRAGGFCYSELEFRSMLEDAKRLMDAGAAGLAFGILTENGELDSERCSRMIETAGGGEMVFHRAFDVMHGRVESDIDGLIAAGFCRVLTSGRMPTAPEGIDVLRRCAEYAADRLEILAGGGVRPHNAAWIMEQTGIRQLHSTFHKSVYDRSAAHACMNFDAPGTEPFAVRIVDKENLKTYISGLKKQQNRRS